MTKIPKVIHYVWVGDNEKPQDVLKCINSWKKFCPDYEIREWGNEQYEQIKNKYAQQAFDAGKWAFVSDFMRLYVLYHEGGIYLDTDVELFENLDEFLNNDFFTGYEEWKGTISPSVTAVLGASKGNKIIKALMDFYYENEFITPKGLDQTPNTYRITEYFSKNYNLNVPYNGDETTVLEDGMIIYPLSYFGLKKEGCKNYAIHYYNLSWTESFRRVNLLNIFNKYIVALFKKSVDTPDKPMPVYRNEKLLGLWHLCGKKHIALIKRVNIEA